MILHGGQQTGGKMDDKIVPSYMFNVVPYQHSTCYFGLNDDEDGFYTVYRNVFLKIYEGEENGWNDTSLHRKHDKQVMPYEYIEFGTSKTDWKHVSQFYSHWDNFSSCLNFAWVDPYDVRQAEDRRMRRAMEDENKKARKIAKRIRNDEIISLVRFVKRRDPRVQNQKIKIHKEKALKEKEKKLALKKKKKDAALNMEVSVNFSKL